MRTSTSMPEVKRIPGVGDAMVMGADYSMRIWLKPDVMAEYKLMPSDVVGGAGRTEYRGCARPFGELGDQSFQYMMRYKGRLQTEQEFEDSRDPSHCRRRGLATQGYRQY